MFSEDYLNLKPESVHELRGIISELARGIIAYDHRGEKFTANDFAAKITELIEKTNKKVYFKIEPTLLWREALEEVMRLKGSGDVSAQVNNANYAEDLLLSDLYTKLKNDDNVDFYQALALKAKDWKQAGIEIDNAKIEALKVQWQNEQNYEL